MFDAAFALATGEGRSLADAPAFANTGAALKCAHSAGGLARRAEVEAALRAARER